MDQTDLPWIELPDPDPGQKPISTKFNPQEGLPREIFSYSKVLGELRMSEILL